MTDERPDPNVIGLEIEPFFDKVLCVKIEAEANAAGLVVVGQEETVPSLARVLDHGPNCRHVCKGQTVFYQKYQGIEYSHEGCTFLLIAEQYVDAGLRIGHQIEERANDPE